MQTVRVGELDLCWDAFGDRSHPPTVLVMGLGTQMTGWRDPFCQELADRGFYVVRFDNRDIGLSTRLDHLGVPDIRELLLARALGRSAQVPYAIGDMARDLVGLLDALDLESAHLVGASMGGMIVQTAAIDAPDRVRSLTSIMSTTGDRRLPWPKLRALYWLSRAAPRELEARAKHYVRLFERIGGGHYTPDPAEFLPIIRADIERAGFNDAGKARQFAAVLMQPDRTRALGRLDLPALVIHGRSDPLMSARCGEATAAAIPGAKTLWLDRMGHELPRPLYPRLADAIAENARR